MKITNEITEKELIITLLSDYLKNYRLVAGLNNMGLDANTYGINLGDTIFKLMEFGDAKDEPIYEQFFKHSQLVLEIDIMRQPEKLDNLVNEIYEWLCKEKKVNEKRK